MKKVIAVLLALSLTACASAPYQPIVDMKGVDAGRAHVDMLECQQYAGRVDPAAQAGGGAVAGAIFGALLGAAIGGSDGEKIGAKAFAVQGAAVGAADGAMTAQQIVKNCMAGRGYKVLA